MQNTSKPQGHEVPEPGQQRLKGLARSAQVLQRARVILLWEQVWPPVFLFLMVLSAYAALSWLGVWLWLPFSLRMLALVLFIGAAFIPLLRLMQVRLPRMADAVSRVEAVSRVSHRPLTAALDVPAGAHDDPASPQAVLWRAHQRRIAASLEGLSAGLPEPQVERRDPYALRALVILGAVIGLIVAGPEWAARLGDIARGKAAEPAAVARLDAWVTPPAYTGKPPIFLKKQVVAADDGPINVPSASVVTVRTVNMGQALVTYDTGKNAPVAIAARAAETPETPGETPGETSGEIAERPVTSGGQQADFEVSLTESGTLGIAHADGSQSFAFSVLPDQAPVISFVNTPEVQRSGALQVLALIKDDYGVVKAEALIDAAKTGAEDGVAAPARPLFAAPEFPLALNGGRVRDGTSKTLRTLVEHPWAGAPVTMTLVAHDEAGLEGRSDPMALTLPMRRFTDPLAKALIEQRRILAMDANHALDLADIIDVLTLYPEQFEEEYGILLTLASIRRGLLDAYDDAHGDESLRKIVADLWDLAVGIEDGDLSEAELALRDALEALNEGIENGASEEELARLMEDARRALDSFMQALAEQSARDQETAGQEESEPDASQMLNPDDLKKMLDRIQDLAKTGSKDAAKQLLSELRQMMENLQASRNQPGQDGENRAQQMLNELGDMIRKQQQLMDQTFRQQREGPGQQEGQRPNDRPNDRQGDQAGRQEDGDRPGSRSAPNQGSNPGSNPGTRQGEAGKENGESQEGLEQGQSALAGRLQKFIDDLGALGGDSSAQLGDAERSMRDAAGEIGKGDLGRAGQEQSDALSQLRSGAQALARQMGGEGEGEGDHTLAQGDRKSDPLGRREGRQGNDFGDDVEVPDEIKTQRAREILEAIRRRLGETARPQLELDYLERLLKAR